MAGVKTLGPATPAQHLDHVNRWLQLVFGFPRYVVVVLASLRGFGTMRYIKEVICSKALKVCIGMARLN